MIKSNIVPYYDRFGKLWLPGANSVLKERVGVFGISFNQRHKLLLTYPSFDLNWPQLPGGGVENNESHEQALLREYNEEVGAIKSMALMPIWSQRVFYYADDKKEFWQYKQFYFLAKIINGSLPIYGKWQSPEQAKAAWLSFSPILSMHDIHKRVLNRIVRLRSIREFYS